MAILWTSNGNSADNMQTFSKGSPPTVSNGKVYIASLSNLVTVYGEKNTSSPDFSLTATGSVAINQGSSGTGTITVNPANGFTGSVSLSASGLPSGVTASFSPASTTGTSTLTLTASAGATVGTSTVTVTGTSGSLTHTTTLSLTVNASGSSG